MFLTNLKCLQVYIIGLVEVMQCNLFFLCVFKFKLEGLWVNEKHEILYAVASHVTITCPMTFHSFPMDVQVCKFQVGSFNFDMTKIIFRHVLNFLVCSLMHFDVPSWFTTLWIYGSKSILFKFTTLLRHDHYNLSMFLQFLILLWPLQ